MLTLKYENGEKFYTDIHGNKYQYDLSLPSDQLAYKLDLAAQMRDRMSLTLARDHNGGGIYE